MSFKIKDNIVGCLLCLFLIGPMASAQEQLNALQLGERLPEQENLEILNVPAGFSLTEKKILVLDFFDTYCLNCIKSMPKLKALQQSLQDDVNIVMVTWQDRSTIEKFYRTNAFLKEHQAYLPTIVGDTVLKKLFPHRGVPHVVFLLDGQVKAVTFGDFVTEQVLSELSATGRISVPLKDDFLVYGKGDASLQEVALPLKGTVQLTAYRDDLPQWQGIKEYADSTGLHHFLMPNVGILDAYKALYAKIKQPKFLLTQQRIHWKVKNKDRYYYEEGTGGQQAWLLKNAISYSRAMERRLEGDELAQVVINDLNHFLGLQVYWDTLQADCLVLRKVGKPKKRVVPQNGQKISGSSVLAFLVDYQGGFPPFVDEADFQDEMVIGAFSSVEDLNKQLEPYGLAAAIEARNIEMLVVEEK